MAQPRLLVTGANGNLGSEILARFQLFPNWDIQGTSRASLDLNAGEAHIQETLSRIKPDIIINAAAFTQVDKAETEPENAYQVNASAPQAMAQWALQNQAYLVHISTDYVFDGDKGEPYLPSDSPNPVNTYGKSKLAGELAVQKAAPSHSVIIRTSWLFGPKANNFIPFLIEAAQTQTPIRVVMDQWGTPTWTGNLVKMLQSVLENRPTGILHGCSRGAVTRLEQAELICQHLGVSTRFITPVTTDSFGFPAKRPVNTAMTPSFECALPWQEAITKFLATLGYLSAHV